MYGKELYDFVDDLKVTELCTELKNGNRTTFDKLLDLCGKYLENIGNDSVFMEISNILFAMIRENLIETIELVNTDPFIGIYDTDVKFICPLTYAIINKKTAIAKGILNAVKDYSCSGCGILDPGEAAVISDEDEIALMIAARKDGELYYAGRYTAIQTACVYFRHDLVKTFIEELHFNPDLTGYYGAPPIVMAAKKNDLPTMEILIKNNASVNQPDEYGATALSYAVTPEIKQLLLDNGARLPDTSETYSGKISKALDENDKAAAEKYTDILLSAEEPRFIRSNRDILYKSVKYNAFGVFRKLIDSGIISSGEYDKPIYDTVFNNSEPTGQKNPEEMLEYIRLLSEHGYKLTKAEKHGITASINASADILNSADRKTVFEMFGLLINAGSDMLADKYDTFMSSLRSRNIRLMEYCIFNGVNISEADMRFPGIITALYSYVFLSEDNYPEYRLLTDYFLSKGADINRTDANGNTALHMLARFRNTDIKFFEILISRGADISIRNNDEQIAFDLAENNDYEPEILFLLSE